MYGFFTETPRNTTNTMNFSFMETMDEEAYEIKKDGMTRAERRAYKRMLAKQKTIRCNNNRYEDNNQRIY